MEIWNEGKIKDFVDVKGGKRLPKGKHLAGFPTAHPYIRIRDIGKSKILQLTDDYEYVDDETQKEISRYIVSKGDLLISVVGTIGLVGIVGDTLDGANQTENCDKLTNFKGIDRDYLYYYLVSPFGKGEIAKGTVGAVQPKLPLKNIQDFTVRYPSLQTQRKIASVLSALDDKIEKNTEINENLEKQAFALFDSCFPAVSAGEKTIGNYITPKRGKNLLSKDAVWGEVPVVAGGLEPSTYHNVANTSSPVLTISASGANSGFVRLWNKPVWSSDSSYIDATMTQHVYFWYVMLKRRQKEIYDSQTGSAQPHIYPQHIAVMPVVELNDNEINSFTAQVAPLFQMIGINVEENNRLTCIRDALLPRLMSGELDVSELDL